ncbi:Chaperone protein DnaJ [Candida tropicalis]
MIVNTIRSFATHTSNNLTHYQILDVSPSASIREIKLQFRKLSKQYHPDLNQHLSDDEREVMKEKYMKMINSYEILKDIKKKKAYDQSLNINHKREWNNKYYGEAKYYSKSGSGSSSSSAHHYTASGLNTKRHKIKYHNDHMNKDSKFSGEYVNYGDRFDVPHFDYEKHLQRNLKFEQHLINKVLDKNTQIKILNQINRNNHDKISEETKTKHLLRHVNMIRHNQNLINKNSPKFGTHTTYSGASTYQNLYQRPPKHPDDDGSMFRTFAILGGAASSLYLLYRTVF